MTNSATPDIERQERHNAVYDSPASAKLRAEEAARGTTTPRSRLMVAQLDERNELAAKHKREGDRLSSKHYDERAENDRFPTRVVDHREQHQAEQERLHDKHTRERDALAKRHRAERDHLRAAK